MEREQPISYLPYRATQAYMQSQNNAIRLITEARMRQSTPAAAPPANYVPAPSQTHHEHSILDKAGSIATTGFLGLLAVAAVQFLIQSAAEAKEAKSEVKEVVVEPGDPPLTDRLLGRIAATMSLLAEVR